MTAKHQLSCRVSSETYNEVQELLTTIGCSTSEYLYSLVIKDLGRRFNGNSTDIERLKEALRDEEIKNIICDIFRERLV